MEAEEKRLNSLPKNSNAWKEAKERFDEYR